MTELEKDVERYLRLEVEKNGGLCLKFPAVFTEGIPDRIVVMPGGRVSFVEMKRPRGGKLADAQIYQIAKLRRRGAKVYVLKNRMEVDEFIKEQTDDHKEANNPYEGAAE